MSPMTPEDLKQLKERVNQANQLAEDGYRVNITVHLGTCGIASGGDRVLEALEDELEQSQRRDIKVVISGCMGMCSSEPNVTIRRLGEEAVVYQKLDEKKMREIFQAHVLNGEIQANYALARIH